MNNESLKVLLFSSDLFVPVAAVSIVSILENNKGFDDITVYIIDDGITDERKKSLNLLVSSFERKICYIQAPDPTSFFHYPFKDRYQMGHSYMRMCVGSLLPDDIERILVLDSDTLVLDDLHCLWQIEMDDNILAGVADCVNVKAYSHQFMLNPQDIYCNAGMFLINLKAWRAHNIEKGICETIKEHKGNIFFFEQTMMNYVCRGKIIKLAPEYNSYTLFYALEYGNLIRWRRPTNFYTEDEVKRASEKPIIVHFTRNFYMTSRPWVEGCDHPLTDEYLKYKMMTPWKEIELDNRSLSEKIRYKLLHCIPQIVLVYTVNVVYNTIRPLMRWRNE